MTAAPTVTVVTPSFNQAAFLPAALESVLSQEGRGEDFELEYIVCDGGSTDGSREILERHGDRLGWWCSEPDGGHYAAVNKGFDRSTGEIMAWLNADDRYCPWALRTVARVFRQHADVQWLTTARPLIWAADGGCATIVCRRAHSSAAVLDGRYLPGGSDLGFLQQESMFWRRSLWERAAGGRLRERFGLAADFDLWARFAVVAELDSVPVPLGGFRCQPAQRSLKIDQYCVEAGEALRDVRDRCGLPRALPPMLPANRPGRLGRTLRRLRGNRGGGPATYAGRIFQMPDPRNEPHRWEPKAAVVA